MRPPPAAERIGCFAASAPRACGVRVIARERGGEIVVPTRGDPLAQAAVRLLRPDVSLAAVRSWFFAIIAPDRNPRVPAKPLPDRSARFRGTRAAHRDETAEDYVEAVGQLLAERGEARVRDLAAMMGVSHVTVSRTVARLRAQGLVGAARHQPITLTPRGRSLAQRARRRHEAVLAFLMHLGVPAAQAEIDAEGIEHHVSDATIRAMERWTSPAP